VRFLVKVTFSLQKANAAAKNGFQVIQSILKQQNPEAAYFLPERGNRTGLFVVHLKDASEVAAIAEPWFIAFDATVEVTPLMLPEDLAKAGPVIAEAVKTYA
jgi:hypothetical protein